MRRIIRWLCCAALVFASACAPLANISRDQPSRPQYTPPPQPMLVLVENYRNPGVVADDAELLARFVHAELSRQNIVPLVEQDALTRLRQLDPGAYRQMNIAAIGRAVGAGQILYIDLLESSTETPLAGQVLRGRLRVRVRVVDALTGATRWPDGSEGHPLNIETPFEPTGEQDAARALREQMHREMASRVSRLFHPSRAAARHQL